MIGRRVLVIGHRGMVGSAIVRRLAREPDVETLHDKDLDARCTADVEQVISQLRPDCIVLAAALVGGIVANSSRQLDFLMENLMIEIGVMTAALNRRVPRLLFLGSSCIYPRHAPQPILEEFLMTGPLEPTNEGYATAKIAGIRMVQYIRQQHSLPWISCMPTNLYGPGDRYEPREQAHVMAAMVRRMVEARRGDAPGVQIMGSGTPRREFLHVDDLADACVLLLRQWDSPMPVNIGSGQELSILELAMLVARIAGFEGSISVDGNRAMDGVPRKRLDWGHLSSLDWRPRISLESGIESAVGDYEARHHAMTDAD